MRRPATAPTKPAPTLPSAVYARARHPDMLNPSPPPPAALPAEPKQPAEPTATGTVAPGKMIHVPIAGELVFAGYDCEGNKITRQKFRVARPGEQVTLPVSEIKALFGSASSKTLTE